MSKSKYSDFGRLVRSLRLAKGYSTQVEPADFVGVSQQTFSRWEAGLSRPRPKELVRLAAVLGDNASALSAAAGYTSSSSVTVSFDRPLPLASLNPDSFEHFCLDFLAVLLQGKAEVHAAGKTGHAQAGIDIKAQFQDGEIDTYQCKREQQFGPEKVKLAISQHHIPSRNKIILLSRVASPEARNQAESIPGWNIWDQTDITLKFRTLPKQEQVRLVDIYFPSQRFALTGEREPGPWLSADEFFAPLLIEGGVFNHRWKLVGRNKELIQIEEAFEDPKTRVVNLIGRAGEGKSRVLRAAVALLTERNHHRRILFASPTEEITAKALEDLGSSEKLVVVDDLHDRSDLKLLLRYAADPASQSQLLLVYRSYWTDNVQREIMQSGFSDSAIVSVKLTRPTKTDAIALATQVLETHGASTGHAEAIAELAYDSPLAVVIGAQIVAKEGVNPQLFGSNNTFRSAVLSRYQKLVARELAQGRDQELIRSILRVLALTQPVDPDDAHFIALLASAESISAPDATRLLRLLKEGGILFARGANYRLSPDLLADSIIETECITLDGQSNGYAERLFDHAIPAYKEHVLLNLGRLDWRRNEGDTSESRLLDRFWERLAWTDDYLRADVKAAAAVAYFQPCQALAFAHRLVEEGHGEDSDVGRIVEAVSYTPRFLEEVCELLWEMGRNDTRPTNQHPYHGIRLLTSLAKPDPRKPKDYVGRTVDFAMSLLDSPESWEGAHTPLDVLSAALEADGTYASPTSSRQITFTRYSIPNRWARDVRKRVVEELIGSLAHSNMWRALLAARYIADALRGPLGGGDDSGGWTEEFEEILSLVDQSIDHRPIPLLVLVRLAESVQWHAEYGRQRAQELARRIISRLDLNLETRTCRALVDGLGTLTWFAADHVSGRARCAQAASDLCEELSSVYIDPSELATFLESCLLKLTSPFASLGYGHSGLFISRLLKANVRLAACIVEDVEHVKFVRLSEHIGRALAVLLEHNRASAHAYVRRLLEQTDRHLSAVAEAYAQANLATLSSVDMEVLRTIFSSSNETVLWTFDSLLMNVARVDPRLAIELASNVDLAMILRDNDNLFMTLASEDSVPFNLIEDVQLKEFVERLRAPSRIDHYWVNRFLEKATRRRPEWVTQLAVNRLADMMEAKDWDRDVIGKLFEESGGSDLLSLSDGPRCLRYMMDWATACNPDGPFEYEFPKMIRAFCDVANLRFTNAIESWLTPSTSSQLRILCELLRAAGPELLRTQESFVAHVLEIARLAGRKTHREVETALVIAGSTGPKSGPSGEPFPSDLKLKSLADERLARIARTDAAYGLYERLRTHAIKEIEACMKEGRRLDAEDEEA